MAKPSVKVTKLTDLIPDDRNANKGTLRGLAMLDDSLREDGAGRGILLDRNGNVIAGNKTLERAVDAGFEEVIVVPTDGKQLVATQRVDVDLDSPKGRMMALRDNRVGQIDLDWDASALQGLLKDGLDLSGLWDDDELAALLADVEQGDPPGDPGAAISRAEEWQKQWTVERGQLWVIGRHRLMCGDSYSAEHIARLMDGKKADMLHTDPPYGIGIVKARDGGSADSGGAKPFTGKVGGKKGDLVYGATGETKRRGPNSAAERSANGAARGHVQHGKPSKNQTIQSNLYPVIEGDDRPFDPTPLLTFAPIVILWGANYYADKLPVSSCWICWDKREDITRNNFADGELAWTNQDKPTRIFHHLWNGLHKGSQWGEARLHPTEKPVALFEEIGKMFADKGLWVDLFAGAGGQLVAAERTGATCYAMEWEPLYVATILQRLSDMGLSPVKAGA